MVHLQLRLTTGPHTNITFSITKQGTVMGAIREVARTAELTNGMELGHLAVVSAAEVRHPPEEEATRSREVREALGQHLLRWIEKGGTDD